MKNSINFVATKNIVKADRYVIRSLYKLNAEIVEELGGEMVKGNEGFMAKFPTATKAKQFVAEAVTEISKKEYNASRKTAPKKVAVSAPKGKGTAKAKTITLTDDEGNTYAIPMSAISKATPKKPTKKAVAPKKGKGNSKQMTEKSKSHQAYLATNKAFKNRKVSYGKWREKYEEILNSL